MRCGRLEYRKTCGRYSSAFSGFFVLSGACCVLVGWGQLSGFFRYKAAGRHKENKRQDQSANDIVLKSSALVGPHENIVDASS